MKSLSNNISFTRLGFLLKKELKEFITEYHNINGAKDFLWDEDKKEDLVLIYRKNNQERRL